MYFLFTFYLLFIYFSDAENQKMWSASQKQNLPREERYESPSLLKGEKGHASGSRGKRTPQEAVTPSPSGSPPRRGAQPEGGTQKGPRAASAKRHRLPKDATNPEQIRNK